MLVNDGEMRVYTSFSIVEEHFTIINEHFTIINEHIFTIISLKYTIIHLFDHHLEAAPTACSFVK